MSSGDTNLMMGQRVYNSPLNRHVTITQVGRTPPSFCSHNKKKRRVDGSFEPKAGEIRRKESFGRGYQKKMRLGQELEWGIVSAGPIAAPSHRFRHGNPFAIRAQRTWSRGFSLRFSTRMQGRACSGGWSRETLRYDVCRGNTPRWKMQAFREHLFREKNSTRSGQRSTADPTRAVSRGDSVDCIHRT